MTWGKTVPAVAYVLAAWIPVASGCLRLMDEATRYRVKDASPFQRIFFQLACTMSSLTDDGNYETILWRHFQRHDNTEDDDDNNDGDDVLLTRRRHVKSL